MARPSPSARGDALMIGYVHAGPPHHGVNRYGRLLAAEIANRPDVCIVECDLQLQGPPPEEQTQIAAAAARLRAADVVHVQYNNQRIGSVWGQGWRQLVNLRLFARTVARPVVVTVHDVYPLLPHGSIAHRPLRAVRTVVGAAPQLLTRTWLRRNAAQLVVCSHEERRRLTDDEARVQVIPHFVEPRLTHVSSAEAKAALGWSGNRVITVLGYIHRRKGHALVVDVLSELPEDVIAVFAGAPVPTDPAVVDRLRARAAARGVAHRLHVTGFIPESQLHLYLMATDVAVCPFAQLSASSSLSTWISAARPIVASNLPQIAEYNALEPGAISTFDPYTASALAKAIGGALERDGRELDSGVAGLRTRLRLSTIADSHLDSYRDVMRRSGSAAAPRGVGAHA
jgi:glycosyltransferase involved in cell wall biosynthesis